MKKELPKPKKTKRRKLSKRPDQKILLKKQQRELDAEELSRLLIFNS